MRKVTKHCWNAVMSVYTSLAPMLCILMKCSHTCLVLILFILMKCSLN